MNEIKLDFVCFKLINRKNIKRNVLDFYLTYYHNDKEYSYFPDFIIDEKYYEIKGLQFFYNKDPNNQMINPYDRSKDDLYEAKHQCMLQNNVEIITDDICYKKYVDETYGKDYINKFKTLISLFEIFPITKEACIPFICKHV